MGASPADKHKKAKDFINRWCDRQKLVVEDVDWATASDPGLQCNCFGFAVGKPRWWQPPYLVNGILANPTDYWPAGIAQSTTVWAYIDAAKTEGFVDAADGAWEDGWETIVLYYTPDDNEFKHAATQTSPGVWASKLGAWSDFEHPPDGIDNVWYGSGRIFMKRPWPYHGPLHVAPATQDV